MANEEFSRHHHGIKRHMETIKEQLSGGGQLDRNEKPLHGAALEAAKQKYNRMTLNAMSKAERDRKTKWRGMHRYDALMTFIREGMPDEEIIRRIGIYREATNGEPSRDIPDCKLLETFKRIARGEISEGHDDMEWNWIMRSLKGE